MRKMTKKKLVRNISNKKIAGVCSGLADYWNIDVSFMRIIFIVLGILQGLGGIIYLIIWAVTPKQKEIAGFFGQEVQNICPHCKNPNSKKLKECEWCGNEIY